MEENVFMNESMKIALLEETQTVVSHAVDGERPITALQVQTDTKVVNYRLYMDSRIIHEQTGLSKSEAKDHVVNAPEDKKFHIGDVAFVRMATVMKWNQPCLQSDDPDVKARGQAFRSSAHGLFTETGAMKSRAIAATTVEKKSNQAKRMKRKQLREAGQDEECQLSQQPINGQDTEMHHVVRVADKPELAAEMDNIVLSLTKRHQEEHKNDKTLPTPSNLDI
ncbi:HNH endonuclease signature motif containing protein [Photobacterium sp. R1]